MPDSEFNNWMDAQLRNVPLPANFHARLAANGPAPSSREADLELDAELRNVPIPPNLEADLRRIAGRIRVAPAWRQLAVAASLFLMLGLSTAGLLGLMTQNDPQAVFAEKPAPKTPVIQSDPRLASVPRARVRPRAVAAAPDAVVVPTSVSPAAAEPSDAGTPEAIAKSRPVRSPIIQGVAAIGASLKQAFDARLSSASALGASGEFDPLPQLDAMEAPLPRGVQPPRVHGYDMLFELRHGEHPFVSPSAHQDLAVSRLPFTFGTASFDRTLRAVASDQLPAADEIRVEEFLAAQDYALPPAARGSLALHSAVSTSPWGNKGLHLMQVAVSAGALRNANHPATQLTLVVDTSARMAGGARWQAVRRALAGVCDSMVSNDRITLIGFAEQPRVLVEGVKADELRSLLGSGKFPEPAGLADFPAAIHAACDALPAVKAKLQQRVVFISSCRDDDDEAAIEKSKQALARLSEAKIPWQILYLTRGQIDPQVAALVAEAHGAVAMASSGSEIQTVLSETLLGRSTTVAAGTTLKLTFNPQVVTSYRLLGHEAATLTGQAGDPLEIDLRAGQTATGLYELWIKPQGDVIATAELLWRDPSNGQSRRVVQQIRREHVSASFSDSPGWFQQGVIAGKTAEALRGSHFVTPSKWLAQVLVAVSQADPRAMERPGFQSLLELVKKADKLR